MRKIVGIGTDLVEKHRIRDLLDRFNRKFVERILSLEEIKKFDAATEGVSFLAKRFAAKEAIAKAIGTGIGPLVFNEISVLNLDNGKPHVSFKGKSKQFVESMNISDDDVMISLSDEREYAVAFVIIQ